MKSWKRGLLIASSVLGLSLALLIHYYFFAEHIVYSKDDPRSGLVFTAVCVSREGSYRTYVKVSLKAGRTVSITEMPGSADMLGDCYQTRHQMVDIQPDPDYRKLLVRYVLPERTVEVPINLEEIEGW